MSFGGPNICDFYDMLYGTAGIDLQTLTCNLYGSASGTIFNGNPPYTATDFLGTYPKFFGPATQFTGLTSTLNSAIVTGFTSLTGIAVGLLVVDPAFPKDTIVTALGSNQITLSNVATANGTTLTIYEAPFVPIAVILSYVLFASASVMQARYVELWPLMMNLFIAHYLTLFMRTESGPNSTAAQVASSGLTKGILISRHAGDVGASSQLLLSAGYEQFGAWNETQYGEQFMTIARAVNMGPVWVG